MVDKTIKTKNYYDEVWINPERLNATDDELLTGFHYGYYEQGIKDLFQAMYNMNDFVGRLLNLDKEKLGEILDVGCGVGSTSIYLAKKFPDNKFTGITLSPNEIKFAKKFIKFKNIDNFTVIEGDYLDTGFPDNYFDGVFALESVSYAQNKREFINEMHRILKPGGRLVVIDGFRKAIPSNSFMKQLYDFHYIARGGADLPELDSFKLILNEKDFKEIHIRDISKNIRGHFINLILDRLPNFLPILLKKYFKHRKQGSKELDHYDRNWLILDFFFGMTRICSYNSIVAVKKPNTANSVNNLASEVASISPENITDSQKISCNN